MGYQVGRICYQTAQEATNVVMTQVVPTIDKDGVLHHPVFDGSNWVYNSQTIQPSFPECEFGAYAEAGKTIGESLVWALVALFTIVVALKAVSLLDEKEE